MADYTQPANVLKRVRFFDGQFLVDQDFIDEQRYHVDRERRTARALGLAGVVDGLVLAPVTGEPWRVQVQAGSAVDPLGRHLLLPEPVVLALPSDRFAGTSGVQVRLYYAERATDLAVSGGGSNRRWDESPVVAAISGSAVAVAPADAPTTFDADGVLLGRISVGAKGEVTVEVASGPRAGLDPRGPFRGRVTMAGNLVVGAEQESNVAGWHRVVDLYGTDHSRFMARTAKITAFLAGHSGLAWGAPAGALVGAETDHPLTLVTNTTARLIVTGGKADATGGRVGIGTMSPEAKLHVVGAGGLTIDLKVNGRLQSLSNDGGLWVMNDRFVGGLQTDKLGLFCGDAWRVVVTKAGDVGVGTATPATNAAWGRALDVYADSSSRLTATTKTITAVHGANGNGYGAPAGAVIGTETDNATTLITNGQARLTVTGGAKTGDANAGRVGIGTTAPQAKLHVAGAGEATVDLLVSGRIRSASEDGGLWAGDSIFFGALDGTPRNFSVWTGGAWNLTVTDAGNLGVGTSVPDNSGRWGRIVDLFGPWNSRYQVRCDYPEGDGRRGAATRVVSFLASHPDRVWSSLPGTLVGSETQHALNLVTSARTRLMITKDGDVGIGTDRDGPIVSEHWVRVLDVAGEGATRIVVRNNREAGVVGMHPGGYGADRGMVIGTETSGAVSLFTTGTRRFSVSERGNVNVGNAVTGVGPDVVRFSVSGETYLDGNLWVRGSLNYFWGPDGVWKNVQNRADNWAGSYTQNGRPSDLRLKTVAGPIEGALGLVRRLRGVRFRWNDEAVLHATSGLDGRPLAGPGATDAEHAAVLAQARRDAAADLQDGDRIGLLAQDVEDALPELVSRDEQGYRRVDYDHLVAVLVEAVKEQQQQIERLAARVGAADIAPA